MKNTVPKVLLGAACLALVATAAWAEELTLDSILTTHRSGAPPDIIVRQVEDPANTLAVAAGDLVALREAGVPESVIAAIRALIPTSEPTESSRPDDARLIDLVRLIRSGISESLIAEQVERSGETYTLSVDDILYLDQNGAGEATISALMATRTRSPTAPPVAPSELIFDRLELVNRGFWRRDREGRLVMRDDSLWWEGSHGSRHDLELQLEGLERIWFTCEPRPSESFCYQLNFEIVEGSTYRFRDLGRESGSNAAITGVAEALRTYYPRLPFGEPDD